MSQTDLDQYRAKQGEASKPGIATAFWIIGWVTAGGSALGYLLTGMSGRAHPSPTVSA